MNLASSQAYTTETYPFTRLQREQTSSNNSNADIALTAVSFSFIAVHVMRSFRL